MRAKQVSDGDRVCFEVRTLVESLYVGGSYDQLNVSSLAMAEVISRRIQAILETPTDCQPKPLRTWAAKRSKEEYDLVASQTLGQKAKVRAGRGQKNMGWRALMGSEMEGGVAGLKPSPSLNGSAIRCRGKSRWADEQLSGSHRRPMTPRGAGMP